MAPFGLGPTELIIILVIVLVLFGGARLAGLGKSTGRAIREFKEETKNLTGDKGESEVVDAEVVDPQQQQQTPPAVGGPQQPQQNVNNVDNTTQNSATQPTEARRDN
ncbi:MAG: twin-arginine translocase TatA/TatE family subunit [Microlunatus sp.]|nr:twin-arginine translocase TatA/TatE family subunit [Microlunatus sp.]